MRNNIRRFFLSFMAFMVIFSGCINENKDETGYAYAGQREEGGNGEKNTHNNTDVVLVMDKSNSMIKADPDRLAIEGAKLFVDMAKLSGIELGMVEFANEIESTGMIPMQDRSDKRTLKDALDNIAYIEMAHTDTGAAMMEAVSELDRSSSGNNKAIILFTDGRTSISKRTVGRTTEDSQNDLAAAVENAKKKGYKIYCIGLNSNGNVDEEELEKIAVDTGGKPHIAKDVDELRDFFALIFSDMGGARELTIDSFIATDEYHTSKITINNANVAEANIVILSSTRVDDVKLSDNNGDDVYLADQNDSVFFAQSDTYSLIKLIRPEPGEWILRVKGVEGDQIKIGMVFISDLGLHVDVDKSTVQKGQSISIQAYLTEDGDPYAGTELYQELDGVIRAADSSGKVIEEKMSINEEGTALAGTFTPLEERDYQVYVHVEGERLFRDSDKIKISVEPEPDMSGILLLFIAFLVLFIILWLLLRRRKIQIEGKFVVRVEDVKKRADTQTTDSVIYGITTEIPADSICKGAFSANELLEIFKKYHDTTIDEERKESFQKCYQEIIEEMKKVKIYGTKTRYEIKIVTNSSSIQLIELGIPGENKMMFVQIDPSGQVKDSKIEKQKEFGIRFIRKNGDYTQLNIIYK